MQAAKRIVIRCLIVSVAWLGMPLPAVHAEMVPTDKVGAATAEGQPTSRERIEALLARADIRAALEQRGIDPEQARARVGALSDEEINELAGKLDTLPAGGDFGGSLISAALIVFIVLLITDILGLTKVFSFTRSQR